MLRISHIARRASPAVLAAALVAGGAVPLAGDGYRVAAQATGPACTDGRNRWLHVRNLSENWLYYFRTRPAFSAEAWGEDMLGQTIILSGSTVAVSMPSAGCACNADVLATFEGPNGPSFSYSGVQYCSWDQEPRQLLIVSDR